MTFARTFIPITSAEAEKLIQAGGNISLFIGRSSCPYCRLFEPKLAKVAQQLGEKIYFLNSEDFGDGSGIQALRAKYGVPTVPGLLVAKGGAVKVICESSLPESAIADFITAI